MLSEAELAEFERWGAVTVETTFTAPELDAAEAGWDALAARIQAASGGEGTTRIGYREMGVPRWPEFAYDASTIDVVQHPWFEAVAKQALRTGSAHFFQQVCSRSCPLPRLPRALCARALARQRRRCRRARWCCPRRRRSTRRRRSSGARGRTGDIQQ